MMAAVYVLDIHHRFDERRCDLRHDRVPVGAQLLHSTGYPMSQREKFLLSWPGFSVPTGNPDEIVPGACTRIRVRRPLHVSPASLYATVFGLPDIGVGHGAKPNPLSDVRSADARSRDICRPNGVAFVFQVSTHSVEPPEAII